MQQIREFVSAIQAAIAFLLTTFLSAEQFRILSSLLRLQPELDQAAEAVLINPKVPASEIFPGRGEAWMLDESEGASLRLIDSFTASLRNVGVLS